MKEVTLDILHDAAHRLMFEMTDEQYQTLLNEFEILKIQMGTIGEVSGLEEYAPMTFPFPCEVSFLREDEPIAPLSREEALANAGSVLDNEIKLPKVVG